MLRLFFSYSDTIFSKGVFLLFCPENFNFFVMKLGILLLVYPIVDKIESKLPNYTSLVMRSNPVHHLFFIFPLENILLFNLNFSTSYDRFKVLMRITISGFYMTWRKKFTKIFTYRWGDLCPPMSKLVKNIFFQINRIINEN